MLLKRLLELLMIRFVLLRRFLFIVVVFPVCDHKTLQLHQFLERDDGRRHVLLLFLLLLLQLFLVVFVILLQRFHHSLLRLLLAINTPLNHHINLAHICLIGIFFLFFLLFGYESLQHLSPTRFLRIRLLEDARHTLFLRLIVTRTAKLYRVSAEQGHDRLHFLSFGLIQR